MKITDPVSTLCFKGSDNTPVFLLHCIMIIITSANEIYYFNLKLFVVVFMYHPKIP